MLTREEALRKHREMWKAMQKDLGDNPGGRARNLFKELWCRIHEDHHIDNYCYLCQYRKEHAFTCGECPIDWGGGLGCVLGNTRYDVSPISEILALPERKVNEDGMVAEEKS